MTIIERIVVLAFSVFFLHASTLEGMVNSWARRMTFLWPSWLKKILYDCPICMTPWWGALFTFLGLLPYKSLQEAALVLAAAAGLNTLIAYLIGDSSAVDDENHIGD